MTHTIYTIKARDKSRENYYAVDQHGNNNNLKKKSQCRARLQKDG